MKPAQPTQPNHAHLLDLPAYASIDDDFIITHEVTRQRFRVEVKQDHSCRAPDAPRRHAQGTTGTEHLIPRD